MFMVMVIHVQYFSYIAARFLFGPGNEDNIVGGVALHLFTS